MRAQKRLLPAACILLIPLTGPTKAELTLNYEGSLDLPRSSIADYYADSVVYVPDGHARPGWSGAAVEGPSLLVYYNWAHQTFEFNQLPALATAAVSVATAVELAPGNGGTYFDEGQRTVNVDGEGNLWDTQGPATSGYPPGMHSDPLPDGTHVLGTTSLSATLGIKESGWPPGAYRMGGCLRRGDAAGGDYPSVGTAEGAMFVYARWYGTGPNAAIVSVYDCARVDAATMSSTEIFKFNTGQTYGTGMYWQWQYVRATDGSEYLVRWEKLPHTGNSYTVDLFAGNTSTDDPTPALSYDVGPDIAGGAGWLASDSAISYIGVDWENSRLCVLDYKGRDVRIHVFNVFVPEPPKGALTIIR